MDYRERWELKDYLIGQTLARRIRLIQVGLVLLLLGFLLDFWYLQGSQGEEYAHLAENNSLRRIPTLPTRGAIFDRRDTALASTRPALDLVVVRAASKDLASELRRLAPILDVPYEELVQRLSRGMNQPAFEPLVLRDDVRLDEVARIEVRRELFPSLEVRETSRRSYVYGDSCSHVIGYVGEAGESEITQLEQLAMGDIIGKSGLERSYDDRLRGARGWDVVTVNNVGRRIGSPWVGREPVHGVPLRLTLDLRLQQALREALGTEAGAGVFMDPRTGEVLALVSTPAFDPNGFADGLTAGAWRAIADDPRRPMHDRAIASYYAPGSVFKVLMAIAGLESGAITPDETVFCGGSVEIYGRERLCWKKGGHGRVNLHQALVHSCNVYFYLLGRELGVDTIHDYGDRFNLGRTTGIDLPGEAKGVLPSKEWKLAMHGEPWYAGDTISLAIGQGLLAVTPVQMVTMMSAVATNGWLPHPHLIRDTAPSPQHLEIAPSTFAAVRRALSEVVESGTGRAAALKNIEVAGKTGTAQVFKHSAGIDADKLPKDERDHAWFVGYAPAAAPTIAFAVVVEHGGHGGTTAAPIARHVLEVYFEREGESPDPRTTAQASGTESEEGEDRADPQSAG